MTEILEKLDPEQILGLFGIGLGAVAILGGVAVAITGVIVANRRKTQSEEIAASLKLDMLERGMSAEDIKKVLEAKMGRSHMAWSVDEARARFAYKCGPRGMAGQGER